MTPKFAGLSNLLTTYQIVSMHNHHVIWEVKLYCSDTIRILVLIQLTILTWSRSDSKYTCMFIMWFHLQTGHCIIVYAYSKFATWLPNLWIVCHHCILFYMCTVRIFHAIPILKLSRLSVSVSKAKWLSSMCKPQGYYSIHVVARIFHKNNIQLPLTSRIIAIQILILKLPSYLRFKSIQWI